MRVSKITIRNILGLDELEIEPGNLTVVSGANGAGKTSTLEAIKAVVEGGHDATLVRHGAEGGEVVLLLDDGTELKKRITEKGSTLTARHPDAGAYGKPLSFVQALTDTLAVNPVAFLTAPPKKRAEYLLESIPMEVTAEQLAEALGDKKAAALIGPGATEGHALDVIERARKVVFDDRTGVNRAAKEKRSTVAQLSATVPAEAEDVSPERLAALEGEGRNLANQDARETERIRNDADAEREAARREATAAMDVARAEYDRRVAEINAERIAAFEKIDARRAERDAALREKTQPRQAEIAAELASLRERAQHAGRAAEARRIVETITGEADALEQHAEALTAALGGLEGLKAKLLKAIPFKVEIRDGEIYRDDVPFGRWNRAEQVKFAINLAAHRAGKLKLICVDGLECLDEETFRAFCARAEKSGLQLIVTRVGEGALTVGPAARELAEVAG